MKHVKSSLSEDLIRYSSVKCLQSDFRPPELEANTQPLVFGGVHLDSDESAAMLLDPKFAVLDSLGARGPGRPGQAQVEQDEGGRAGGGHH